MHVQVGDLYRLAQEKYGLALLAGRDGLHHSANWVYLAEDIRNASFLKGGELIITTGLFRQSGTELSTFIRTMVECRSSGILVNLGPYIATEDITPDLLSYCNANRLPLFSMPWESRLTGIMQDFGRLFLQENRREEQLNISLQSALCQDEVPEGILQSLRQYGFTGESPCFIAAIRGLPDRNRAVSRLNALDIIFHLFPYDGLYALLVCLRGSPMAEVVDAVGRDAAFGISSTEDSLAHLGKDYRRARTALAIAEERGQHMLRFDELGIIQLLVDADAKLMRSLVERYLGPVERYDAAHRSDLLKTLRAYLLSGGSHLGTAARIHAHRNTVVYRVRKIAELLNTNLNDATVQFDLMTALFLREYLSVQ